MGLSVCSFSQTIGISMGTHLISDKFIFQDNAYNWYPRPFTFVGLNYSTKQVTMSVTYSFDSNIVSISSAIPLWNINKKKYNNYALLNNRQ